MGSSTRSTHSDNDMARFLFAILKQCDLKTINWPQVATDPALKEPITNGHAARMRYSRFRETINNTVKGVDIKNDRKKKNRTIDSKARVTKPKGRSGSLKIESGGSEIKSERSQHAPISQYSPASVASSYLVDNRDGFNSRFLTPCSDDMNQGLAVNPAVVGNLSCPPPADFSPQLAFMSHPAHSYSPALSAFDDAAFDISNLSAESNFSTESNAHSYIDFTPDWSDCLQTQF